MNTLRSVHQAKINLLFFMDIITSVMGILILVTLMLSLSIRSGEFGDTPDSPFESRLAELKQRLTQLESENRLAQQNILDAATLPERDALESQAEALRRARIQAAESLSRFEQSAARAQRNATNSVNLDELERTFASLRDQLAAMRAQSNSVFIALPPEFNQLAREPVAFIVSKEKLQIRKLSGRDPSDVPVSVATDLSKALQAFDPEHDYIIFYFRPSGVKWFTDFREAARAAGFQIGYDAVEEQQEIQFAKP